MKRTKTTLTERAIMDTRIKTFLMLLVGGIAMQPAGVRSQVIELAWTINPEPAVVESRIYRKVDQETSFSLISSIAYPDSIFLDEDIELNQQYYYAVTAVDSIGNESDFSNIAEVITTGNAPVASADEATTEEDMPVEIDVLANDFDMDGDLLTVIEVTQPDKGFATIDSMGMVRYIPAPNASGSDSFYYTASDGYGGTTQAQVNVIINPVEDPPGDFSLLAPENETTLSQNHVAFVWSSSNEVDGDTLCYEFLATINGMELSFEVTDTAMVVDLTELDLQGGHYVVSWSVMASDGKNTTEPVNGPGSFIVDVITGVHNPVSSGIPDGYRIEQNYPNPFNPSTRISYQVPETAQVTVAIYNVRGQHIVTLVDGTHGPGYYNEVWNGMDKTGRKVQSGNYFYRVRAVGGERGEFSEVRKMVLVE